MASLYSTLRTASVGGMAILYTALTFGATLAPAYAASGVYYQTMASPAVHA